MNVPAVRVVMGAMGMSVRMGIVSVVVAGVGMSAHRCLFYANADAFERREGAGLKPGRYKGEEKSTDLKIGHYKREEKSTGLKTRHYNYFKAEARVLPRSAGVSTVLIPAAAIAAYLSLAVPCPPEMMAPA
jgi:hypothetical protein